MTHKAEYLEHVTELRSWARARRLYMQARGMPDYKDTSTRLERIADILEQDSRVTSGALEEMATTLEVPANDVPRTVAGLKAKYKTVRGVLAEIATRHGIDDQKTGWTRQTRNAVMAAANVAGVPEPTSRVVQTLYNVLSTFYHDLTATNLEAARCALGTRPLLPSNYEGTLRQLNAHLKIIADNWGDDELVRAIVRADSESLHGMMRA